MNCFCVSWSRDQVRQRAYWSGELVLPFQPMRCRTKTNHLLEFPSFSSFEQFSHFYFGLLIPSTNHFPSLISTCVYVPQYNFNFWQSAGHLRKLWPIWRIWIKKVCDFRRWDNLLVWHKLRGIYALCKFIGQQQVFILLENAPVQSECRAEQFYPDWPVSTYLVIQESSFIMVSYSIACARQHTLCHK